MVWTFLLFEGIEQEKVRELTGGDEERYEWNRWQNLPVVINCHHYFAKEDAKTRGGWLALPTISQQQKKRQPWGFKKGQN